MRIITPCLLVLVCMFCFSCSLKQQHVLFEQKNNVIADSTAKQAQQYSYRIKPDDILQIRNLQDPKFLGNSTSGGGAIQSAPTFQVDEDGEVTLPVLGHIAIAGLTRTEAEKKLQALYSESQLVNPIIELKITNLQVRIFGEVAAQGNYALLKEKTTLVDLLGQAGGLTKNADEKNVRIVRGKGQQELHFDLGNKQTLADPRIILQNEDIVLVGQSKRAVRDDKIQNFSSLAAPSLLLLNTSLIILSLFR